MSQAAEIVKSLVNSYGEEAVVDSLLAIQRKLAVEDLTRDGNFENPWDPRTKNLTRQGVISQKDPVLAEELRRQAAE